MWSRCCPRRLFGICHWMGHDVRYCAKGENQKIVWASLEQYVHWPCWVSWRYLRNSSEVMQSGGVRVVPEDVNWNLGTYVGVSPAAMVCVVLSADEPLESCWGVGSSGCMCKVGEDKPYFVWAVFVMIWVYVVFRIGVRNGGHKGL